MFEAGLLSEFGFLVSFWHPRRFSLGLDSREQPSGYVWPWGYVEARTAFWVRPAQQRRSVLLWLIGTVGSLVARIFFKLFEG